MKKLFFSIVLVVNCSTVIHAWQLKPGSEFDRDAFWTNLWQKERRPEMTDEKTRTPQLKWQYEERAEIDNATLQYVTNVYQNGGFYHDPFVEDYLTQVLHQVVGSAPIPGRPGTPHIRILKNPTPNAFAYNNAGIIITTGMLSIVRTEIELKGVLAHEVAHIILDHNLKNYSSAKSSQALANFFGVAGAILGGVAASKSSSEKMDYSEYSRFVKNAMIGSGFFFYSLTKGILDIVGAAYSRGQEEEADLAARDFLVKMGLDGREYGDLLLRLGEFSKTNGLDMSASLLASHPAIKDRLQELDYKNDKLVEKNDNIFDRIIADCLTYNAALQFYQDKYDLALSNLERAIRSGLAVEETYLLHAIALRHLASDAKTNQEALRSLDLAVERRTAGSRFIHSERGLLYLRLGDFSKAQAAFESYLSILSRANPDDYHDEIDWGRKMLARCKLLLSK